MGVGDQASIGAFLYNNDTHELDFEIGYGKQTERASLNALDDELIVYMTSQAILPKRIAKPSNENNGIICP